MPWGSDRPLPRAGERASAATRGAGERIMEGGGSPGQNAKGTPHSPPFCFPPFSCHPKAPTAKTTALAPPPGVGVGGSGRGLEGTGCQRDPHLLTFPLPQMAAAAEGAGSRVAGGKLGD